MGRYFVRLRFMGTRYAGWQVQPGKKTVQGELEGAFSLLAGRPVALTGAGRTDAGVHASCFVAHFDLEQLPFIPGDLVYKLNRLLPPDIALQELWPVPSGAHARFSALSRTYRYRISRLKDPFVRETSWHYSFPLDVAAMNLAAGRLLLHSDFTSFSKLHTQVATPYCTVTEACWEESREQLVFTITANRFLRNMVRAVVGTLLEVGKGKLSVEGFEQIIAKRDRCAAGMSVPAHGLFLEAIAYPPAEELLYRNTGAGEGPKGAPG